MPLFPVNVELDTQCDRRTWFQNEVPTRLFGPKKRVVFAVQENKYCGVPLVL